MPDQKLTQAVRDRNLAVRRACLRRVLNDKVRFLLLIVIQNLNVWILWRNCRCWNTDQIFCDRKRLLLQIQIGNFQRQHLADAESDKQGRQNRDALRFPHDLLNEDLHFRRTQDTHLRRNNFRPCRVNRGITRQLVFPHGVRKKVLQQHMLVLNGLCGQAAFPPIQTTAAFLLPLIVVLHNVLCDLIKRQVSKGFREMNPIGIQIACIGRRLSGRRRFVKLKPFEEGF